MGLFTTGLAPKPKTSLFGGGFGGGGLEQTLAEIAKTESGGNYGALGPIIKSGMYAGDRAYGKYQIMGKNVPAWTKQYLGKSYTPQEFVKSPQLQESLMRARAQDLYSKYGSWQDVKSVHFTGRPYAQAVAEGAKDQLGTTVQQYVGSPMGQSTPQMVAPQQNIFGSLLAGPIESAKSVVESVKQRSFTPFLQSLSKYAHEGDVVFGKGTDKQIVIPGVVNTLALGSIGPSGSLGEKVSLFAKRIAPLTNKTKIAALAEEILGVDKTLAKVIAGRFGPIKDIGIIEKKLGPLLQTTTARTIANGDSGALFSKNGAWPTTASKPSKAGVTSTGSAPTGKEGVSAQRAGTSGPFEGTKVYHGGTPFDAAKFDPKVGISVTPSPKAAEHFAFVGPNRPRADFVHELVISPDAKILPFSQIPKHLYTYNKFTESRVPLDRGKNFEDIIQYARERGYDGVDLRNFGSKDYTEAEIRIINPDVIRPYSVGTASQGSPQLRQTAPSPKTNSQNRPLQQDDTLSTVSSISSKATKPTGTRNEVIPSPSIPKELEPLAAEARKYKSAEEFIASKLGGEISAKNKVFSTETNPDFVHRLGKGTEITLDGNRLGIHIEEQSGALMLKGIAVEGKGGGVGTRALNALKEYADQTNKRIFVEDVVNPQFFKQFKWLKKEGQDFVYTPNKATGGTPKGGTPFEVAVKIEPPPVSKTLTPPAKSASRQQPPRPPSVSPSPKNTPNLPEAPVKGTKLSTIRKWFTSGRKILQKSGPSGTKMAAIMDTQRTANDLLVGKYNVLIKKALQGLTKEERLNVTDVLEGGGPMNAKVAAAAEKLRNWLDEVAQRAETEGFEMRTQKGGTVPFRKRENYFPRQYDFDSLAKGKQRDAALEHLVKTGQARNLAEAEETLNNMLANAERRAGNLENPRMVDLPGYEKDPSIALPRYANSVATRFTEAEHFGKKDEVIADLIKQITNEGGDYREAQRIFDFTVDGAPKNKVVSAVTQFNVATKLSLSAIVNATQSINTATKAGVLNTVRGMWRGFTKEGKELAELINVYDDFVLVKETGVQPRRIVRGVMWVFKKVEHFNRRSAANAAHYKLPQLLKTLRTDPNSAYAVRQLDSLGVDIEKALTGKLTDDDLLTAANKMVEKTQFKIDPLDVPPSWKTPLGRLLVQFKSFSFMQTKFVRDEVLKEAAKGNLVPLVTFVMLAVPASYAVAMVRNALTGREQGNVDIRVWDQWMKGFGTIPTDLIIQGKFLADTFASDFKTPIEKGSRAVSTVLGPTADELGKAIAGAENIPRTEEKNQYLRKTGREQDPYLLFKRQLVEKIPFAGQYLKNKYFDFPKSTRTEEQKATDAPMYDLIDELYKEDYEDPSVKERVIEYMKTLDSDDERKRQLYIMNQNGIKTTGISSSKAILDLRPVYEEIQRVKKEDPNKALQMVEELSDEDYETYKKIRASERAKTTEKLRELLSTDPEAAVAFLRSQEPEEQERLLDVMTDDEYALYEKGK